MSTAIRIDNAIHPINALRPAIKQINFKNTNFSRTIWTQDHS